MQLVHIENNLCFLIEMFAPRPICLMLFCTKGQGLLFLPEVTLGNAAATSALHPRTRAGSTLHIFNLWMCPKRFGTKLMASKTIQSLKHYSLINHTYLCGRIRRTLSLWCLNPNWNPVLPAHTLLVWDLGGEMCEHLLLGNKGVYSSKDSCLPPIAHQISKHHGIVQDQWTQWGLEF